MPELFPHLDYKPRMPKRLDRGIGIVGAGGIVNYAHLPAYKKAGFRVVGILDKNREQAEKTARQHGIPKVYASSTNFWSSVTLKLWTSPSIPPSRWK